MPLQLRAEAPARKPYPSDVSDEEWAFVAPYLTLLREDAGQRQYPLREVFNALRWMVRAGAEAAGRGAPLMIGQLGSTALLVLSRFAHAP
jgi:hypothetical protein